MEEQQKTQRPPEHSKPMEVVRKEIQELKEASARDARAWEQRETLANSHAVRHGLFGRV